MAKKIVSDTKVSKSPFVERYVEVKAHEYKGVKVIVKVDYKKGKISLVEAVPQTTWSGTSPTLFPAKKWVFEGRELGYMQGWQDILDAMKNAVSIATAELTIYTEAIKDKELVHFNKMAAMIAAEEKAIKNSF